MFNYLTQFTTYQLPLNIRQTNPITLDSLPVIGGFLNKLLAGIPVGFKTDVATLPFSSHRPFLLNSGMYDYATDSLYSETEETLSIIPLNMFDSSLDQLNALMGASAQSTAFTFTLTNKLSTHSWNESSEKSANPDVINSRELGQFVNDKVYLLDIDSQLQAPTFNDTFKGYIIDAVHMQQIGQCDYSLVFFSQPQNPTAPVDWNNSVYIAKYQTLSKASKTTRLWTELKQLSNPNFSFNNQFHYPQSLIPPAPNGQAIVVDFTNNPQVIQFNNDYNLSQNARMCDVTNTPFIETLLQRGIPSNRWAPAPFAPAEISDSSSQAFDGDITISQNTIQIYTPTGYTWQSLEMSIEMQIEIDYSVGLPSSPIHKLINTTQQQVFSVPIATNIIVSQNGDIEFLKGDSQALYDNQNYSIMASSTTNTYDCNMGLRFHPTSDQTFNWNSTTNTLTFPSSIPLNNITSPDGHDFKKWGAFIQYHNISPNTISQILEGNFSSVFDKNTANPCTGNFSDSLPATSVRATLKITKLNGHFIRNSI